ncbi:MAG: ion channel [Halobacteriota archaeon]|nr:ion channel [Halobacteriota archaeon]
MCEYSGFGWKCPHDKLPDSEYCIFHLEDDNKDIKAFNSGIDEILNTEEEVIHFNDFYFPPGTPDFYHKKFKQDVEFTGAKFCDGVNFVFSEFLKNADFQNARFYGKVAFFNEVKFKGYANFRDAIFCKSVYFRKSEFSEDVNRKSVGHKNADVEAIFDLVKFKERVSFREAKFFKNVSFEATDFLDYTYFEETEFHEHADFSKVKFDGITTFAPEKPETPEKSKTIDFRDAFFSENVKIEADLSECYLYDSNIYRLDLTDSKWPEETKKWHIFSEGIKIWEETEGELEYNDLVGIYRRLKQSHQRYGDHSTAGEFYYREMECKRRQMGFFQKQFWNIFYRGLCGYGERPFRVILASLGLILLFAVLYFFNGIMLVGAELSTDSIINYKLNFSNTSFSNMSFSTIDYSMFKDFLWCCYTSVITFTTLGYGDVHPIGWSRVVASVETILGIFMTALLIFVFGRKMLR